MLDSEPHTEPLSSPPIRFAERPHAIFGTRLLDLDELLTSSAVGDVEGEQRPYAGRVELVFDRGGLDIAGVHGDQRLPVASGLYLNQIVCGKDLAIVFGLALLVLLPVLLADLRLGREHDGGAPGVLYWLPANGLL